MRTDLNSNFTGNMGHPDRENALEPETIPRSRVSFTVAAA